MADWASVNTTRRLGSSYHGLFICIEDFLADCSDEALKSAVTVVTGGAADVDQKTLSKSPLISVQTATNIMAWDRASMITVSTVLTAYIKEVSRVKSTSTKSNLKYLSALKKAIVTYLETAPESRTASTLLIDDEMFAHVRREIRDDLESAIETAHAALKMYMDAEE